MRLLSIGSLPPEWGGPSHGGVATFHRTLLEGLMEDGSVEIAAVLAPTEPGRELPFPVEVRPAQTPTATFYKRLLERLAPDAVVMHHFAHTIGVTHARLDSPPPALGIAHSWHSITLRAGEERRQATAVTREALGGLTALVVGSRHCLREGEQLGMPYPARTDTIHYPLPYPYLDGVDDVDAQERRGVVYLGSLIPRKNPVGLVEAAARLPDIEIELAGHGELEQPLRARIAELSLADRVAISHHHTPADVRELLVRAQAMCLPSRSETFGIAYTEALACGTPVVGFGPTVREIRDALGIDIGEALDPDASPDEIAAAIRRVTGASWDRAELRRRTIEVFGTRAAAERYASLLRRIAEPAEPEHAAARRPPR